MAGNLTPTATLNSTPTPTLPLAGGGYKIALAQINATVGDIAGNCAKILAAYKQAAGQGAELVVFPELCVVGYPPEDLVLMPEFRARAMAALNDLARATEGSAAMLVGAVWDNALVTSGADTHIYNAAVLLDAGRIQHVQPKTHLPNYGIFDEKRLFDTAAPEVMEWRGRKLGVLVCEDVWQPDVPLALKEQGAECLIVINASPFEAGKMAARRKVVSEAVRDSGLPCVYVNLVGGQDDIVFDGGSFVLLPFSSPLEGEGRDGGVLALQMKKFEEEIALFSLKNSTPTSPPPNLPPQGGEEYGDLWSAMKLGLADYAQKNGFSGVLLGLSGGIDSALTAACAVDALGSSNVRGVLLPSPYTSKDSTEDALELAKNLGIKTDIIPISPAMETMEKTLTPVFSPSTINHQPSIWMENLAIGGNVQARLRGLTLMALSNESGWLLLSTGNKSELAVGYSTLYGDSCGGYNVLKDLYKTQVYALARWRNAIGCVIPERSITKPPTAELKPGQTDQDQLPPYDILDAILEMHIEGRLSADEIVGKHFDKATVEKIVRLVRLSEYKRRQSCPGVKLSPMLFGKDRRYPLTNFY